MNLSSFYSSYQNQDQIMNLESDEISSNSPSDDILDTEEDVSYSESELSYSSDILEASNSSISENWGDVKVNQRFYLFTDKEQLLSRPSSSMLDGKIYAYDIFRLFMTDEMFQMIVDETNRFAQQTIEATRNSHLSWVPTHLDEIKRFFGIIVFMQLNTKPEIDLYWSKKKHWECPFIRHSMARDRFRILLRFLQFADNSQAHNEDKLAKLRPFTKKLSERFRSVYLPGSKMIVDELLVPFQDRLHFKEHKYGYKVFKICTPESYTWNFELYAGKYNDSESVELAESLVVYLAERLLNKGRTIYADSFFTSLSLAHYLLKAKTYYCGLLRRMKKHLPADVIYAKLKKGEVVSKQDLKGVKVTNWKDKKNVLTLSTIPEHSGQLVPSGKRSRNGDEILKSESFLEYHLVRKSIDVADQMASYRAVVISRKWYKKIAFELITGTSVINSWYIYNKYYNDNNNPVTITDFKESLMLSLITGCPSEKVKPGLKKIITPVSGNRAAHFLGEAPGPKIKSRKRCRGCYEIISKIRGCKEARLKARRVSTYCESCEGTPFLCLDCFKLKHEA